MSPGMKKRIRTGQYDFPSTEWKHVSSEAKELIRSMLQTEATKRPTIDQVMQNKWIAVNKNCYTVTSFPLTVIVFIVCVAFCCRTTDAIGNRNGVEGRRRGLA